MAELFVFGVDSPQTAEKVFELADELNRQQLLELADAAWVERSADGKVKLHQSSTSRRPGQATEQRAEPFGGPFLACCSSTRSPARSLALGSVLGQVPSAVH